MKKVAYCLRINLEFSLSRKLGIASFIVFVKQILQMQVTAWDIDAWSIDGGYGMARMGGLNFSFHGPNLYPVLCVYCSPLIKLNQIVNIEGAEN